MNFEHNGSSYHLVFGSPEEFFFFELWRGEEGPLMSIELRDSGDVVFQSWIEDAGKGLSDGVPLGVVEQFIQAFRDELEARPGLQKWLV